MKIPALQKVSVALASDVLAKCEPTDDGKKLAQPGMTPSRFVEAAVAAEAFPDAIRFLAFALPIREAVWWACLVVRDSLGKEITPQGAAVLEAVEAWVYKPADANRRAVFAKGEAVGFDNPVGYLALGAFWSGGSMAPPGLPEVPPDPALAPNAVAAAILLAAVVSGPEQAVERYGRALARAVSIANGGDGRQI
ncbi:MAG: hypothetical protein FJX54_04890 [Alphaproteobacteria bacterium]|nr:hypothetical protein [Alphaproteobacteria bacterium]